jgi:RNA polymerase sigma-70 factor (ECF subfamily)
VLLLTPPRRGRGAAARAEHRAKIRRYIDQLPEEEAEAIQLVDLMEMSVAAAAEALGRPRGTVVTQLVRARKMLCDLALASERATTLGAPRVK